MIIDLRAGPHRPQTALSPQIMEAAVEVVAIAATSTATF
jgi:hypothetical protein